MKDDDETQPSPAEDAGQHVEGPPTPDRPAAEGPATDSGSQAGPPTPGSEPPPPGGYGPPSSEAHPQGAYVRPARLTRRARGQDRVIGGVAGGIADYFGVDPLLVRLAFVGFSLLGGGGIVLYVLGWIFIPERGEGEVVGRASRVDAAKYLGMGLIAIATLILVDGIGFDSGDGGFGPLEHLFFATILVGLGVFLLRSSEPERGPAQPPPPPVYPYVPTGGPTGGGASTSSVAAPVQTQPLPRSTHAASSIGYEPREQRAKPRERSQLGLLTLAAVLLVTGAAALLNNMGVTSFDGGQLSALALTVLGVGLIVGAWLGRARWLIWIGVVMFPFVAFFSLVDLSMVPFDGEVGELSLRPVDQIEISKGYELLAGEAHIDLSDFEFSPDEDARLSIDMAVGETTVRVPRDVYVEADLSLQAGEITFFNTQRTGQGVTIVDSDGDPESDARLTLVIDGALGAIEIDRSAERAEVERQVSEAEENAEKPKGRERERP
jgi:phage shock protein PspC (stress-responsive transcriptional regulator)